MADLIIFSSCSGTRIDITVAAQETVAALKERISAQAAAKHAQGKSPQAQNMVLVWRGTELADGDAVLCKVAHAKDNTLLLQWSPSRFAEKAAEMQEQAKLELAAVGEQAKASRAQAIDARTSAVADAAAAAESDRDRLAALKSAGRERFKKRIASAGDTITGGSYASFAVLDGQRHQVELNQLVELKASLLAASKQQQQQQQQQQQ